MTYLHIDSLRKFVDHSVANVTSDFISNGHLKQEASQARSAPVDMPHGVGAGSRAPDSFRPPPGHREQHLHKGGECAGGLTGEVQKARAGWYRVWCTYSGVLHRDLLPS